LALKLACWPALRGLVTVGADVAARSLWPSDFDRGLVVCDKRNILLFMAVARNCYSGPYSRYDSVSIARGQVR